MRAASCWPKDGKLEVEIPPYDYPDKAKNTVRLGKKLAARDFDVAAPQGANEVRARVIGVIENQAPTKALEADLPSRTGWSRWTGATTSARSRWSSGIAARGWWSTPSSRASATWRTARIASTVAHDSHHMIVVGTNKDDMAKAANRLGEVGGGVVLFSKGKEIAIVEMPIAGLMSDERAEIVAPRRVKLTEAMRKMGCSLNNAYMQHSLLALVVIPELRISDVGLVDVTTFEKVDLFPVAAARPSAFRPGSGRYSPTATLRTAARRR